MIIKRSLGITIFEAQIYRNYFGSDDTELLQVLAEEFDFVLFCSPELEAPLRKSLSNARLSNQVDVRIFISPKLPWLFLKVAALLRLLSRSNTIRNSIFRQYSTDYRVSIVMRFKLFLNRVGAEWPLLGKSLRNLLSYLISSYQILQGLAGEGIAKIDVLLVTSLTNLKDDVLIAMLYKKVTDAKIIGTPRSWDNISSHGLLPFMPDTLLLHSKHMERDVELHQFVGKTEIKLLPSPPNYRFKISKPETQRHRYKSMPNETKLSILYACVGDSFNPDEKDFIFQDFNAMAERFPQHSFLVLEHPAFPRNYEFIERGNVSTKQFDFVKHPLEEYYEFLAGMSVIICGGTSVILDALYVDTPVWLLNYETFNKPFHLSAKRSFDTLDHTRKLVNLIRFKTLNSFDEMMDGVVELSRDNSKQANPIAHSDIFIGNTEPSFAKSLLDLVK